MVSPDKCLEWWETGWRFPAPLIGDESQFVRLREATQAEKFSENYTAHGLLHILLQSSKEIIFKWSIGYLFNFAYHSCHKTFQTLLY